MKPRRSPVTPPTSIGKKLKAAALSGDAQIMDGVTLYPPTGKKPTWRVVVWFGGKPKELSAGRTVDDAYAGFLELYAWLKSRQAGVQGLPTQSHQNSGDVLADYVSQGGARNSWKARTVRDRTRDFAPFILTLRNSKIECSQLNVDHIRQYVLSHAGTQGRGDLLIGITRTFLEWGLKQGHFTPEQARLCDQVSWTAPKGSKYRKAPNRRKQSQRLAALSGQQGGEVPTHKQVIDFAQGCQKYYPFGEGLIHISANLGTRASETFVFTASREVGELGQGNFVDLENLVVRVNTQVNDDPTIDSKTTKNGKTRQVVIPHLRNVESGFDVQEWLLLRCTQALLEQAAGANPLALLFPNSRGGILGLSNVDSRVCGPAADDLGWRMEEQTTARGRTFALRRFTLHSMRDRYGTTAAYEWGYQENELLEQGSWADIQTVRRFYLGTTDMTFSSVLKKHQGDLLAN
jgi:hypothetical protein